jgi:hypothetical protein
MDIGDVVVMAAPEHAGLGTSLAEAAAEIRDWPGLGRVDVTPLTLVLVPDAAAFGQWSRGRVPEWGAGLTLPARRLIVIRVDAGRPFATLRHELAHLAFHLRVAGRVPLWFSEGYAVMASGELDRLAGLQVNLAVALGRIPTLSGLDQALRGNAGDAGTAYALAGVAVAEISRRHPSGSLDAMMGRLVDSVPFGSALLASTGLDLEGFGDSWRKTISKRYNLGLWALAGGGWVIVLVALGIGSVRRRRRDAPRRAALDEGWTVTPDDGTVETG